MVIGQTRISPATAGETDRPARAGGEASVEAEVGVVAASEVALAVSAAVVSDDNAKWV